MIGQQVHHYKIQSQLGGGGMGVVYRAQDARLGRTVALKFLPDEFGHDPQALERFEREARAASSLNHPHICTIFDVGDWESRRYIVMELLEGQTASDALDHGSFPVDDVFEIAIQLADALDAAHSTGIIHRDIKPANIMISSRGHATLLDFGLAKRTGAPEGSDSTVTGNLGLTRPGSTLGTIAYMSPEQVRGEDLDARTDLFSFGAVLYELVTGQAAFQANTAGLIFDAVLNRRATPVAQLMPRVPAGLSALIERLLEKDRNLRYQTARDLRADLKRIRRSSFAHEVHASESTAGYHASSSPAGASEAPAKTGAAPAAATAPRRWDMARHVQILGIAYIVWGAIRVLTAIVRMLSGTPDGGLFPGQMAWLLISGAVMAGVGFQVRRHRPQARNFAIVVAFLMLFAPVLGWIVAGYAAWVLLSKEGQAQFKPRPAP